MTEPTKMNRNTANKIVGLVAKSEGTTSVGLLWFAFPGCRLETVRARVETLIAEGRLQRGWDGNSLELTDAERKDRAMDARVKSRK